VNLTDLREELRARSAPGPDLVGALRLAAVRHRVRAMRRRRFVAGGATLVVILVAVTGYGAVAAHRSTTLRPEPPGFSVDDFPRYATGARLVDARAVSPVGTEIVLSGVVGALGVVVANRCDMPGTAVLIVHWSFEGREAFSMPCTESVWTSPATSGNDLAWLGVPLDRPIRVTARIDATDGVRRPVDLSRGAFAAALMERIPFEEYQLPPRPPVLAPLSSRVDTTKGPPGKVLVESDPADPNATRTGVLAEPGEFLITMAAQTPGSIRIDHDGATVCTAEWWDYEANLRGCSSSKGWPTARPLTVTFVPEHMTGPWRAAIVPQ